jgi:hypothetical protein
LVRLCRVDWTCYRWSLPGAVLVFGCGLAWASADVYVAFRLCHPLRHMRAGLVVAAAVCLCGYGVCGLTSHLMDPSTKNGEWTTSSPGNVPHVVSAFSEWLLALFFMLFYLTFYFDFRAVTLATTLAIRPVHARKPSEAAPLLLA